MLLMQHAARSFDQSHGYARSSAKHHVFEGPWAGPEAGTKHPPVHLAPGPQKDDALGGAPRGVELPRSGDALGRYERGDPGLTRNKKLRKGPASCNFMFAFFHPFPFPLHQVTLGRPPSFLGHHGPVG